MRDKIVEEGFYTQVAEILGVSLNYRHYPFKRPTRWNNRTAGNGRFEGYGLIRMFGPNCIHVSLTNPIKVNRIFSNVEDVYAFLRTL